eukprot:CAMPEP_0119552566 /NCGR_PEP_ID=MMETSP1352-20130426/5514_1 /TAXON_ID=265584 /ORGANISM="Stauroneis constricta, Strain CCMP1120" /LENGTH=442 /DNA_ID=CAMNT_0007598813 /DNA_START=102 /DNA_END=1430 /DNA_ORIENTATION=-
MPPNTRGFHVINPIVNINNGDDVVIPEDDAKIHCAIIGCGMMGQEHISYIMSYSQHIQIDFLCDPHEPSLAKALSVMRKFQQEKSSSTILSHEPTTFTNEDDLLRRAALNQIDLLVIASPNHLHTPTLLRWAKHDLTILVEKPVAVNKEQISQLRQLSQHPEWNARIWVAMEYRFIPAIAKLISLLPTVGEIKMVTIRENRYPFLHKINGWNRNLANTGDSLVEKCCHFFDLFRLITGQEAKLSKVRAIAQRGLNYETEEPVPDQQPIIDSAFVTLPFKKVSSHDGAIDDRWKNTIGCLELCMYAEGSRHQEEVIVTGTKGRLEAYLPENKVYMYQRPSHKTWNDRSVPPPVDSIGRHVFDCTNVKEVHGIDDCDLPTHGGYHYSSTGVEWYYLLSELRKHKRTGTFKPQVSLEDGIRAVEIGLKATSAIVNNLDDDDDDED